MRRASARERLLLGSISTILAVPALASDGALQINQACAVQTGCFTGDTAGFPVTIATAGSYVLTGNLVIPDEHVDVIIVQAPNVHIDLNGFSIARQGCLDVPSCTRKTGDGNAILVSDSNVRSVSVANGSVVGTGRGVELRDDAQVRNLTVRLTGGTGIRVQSSSIVSGCAAIENGGNGISLEGDGAVVSGSTARGNVFNGIFGGEGSAVSGNSAHGNANGIVAVDGSTVSDNSASANTQYGILTGPGTAVRGNVVRNNQTYGLSLTFDSTYRENTSTSNAVGAVLGGVNLGDNYCAGTGVVSASCP